jgi:transcriptional regulator with XRE-family HTH domain
LKHYRLSRVFELSCLTENTNCCLRSTEKLKKFSMELNFAQRLKLVREKAGLKSIEFARQLGYGRSYISRLESGEAANPSREFVLKVADRFACNAIWLLSGNGEPSDVSQKTIGGLSLQEGALSSNSFAEIADMELAMRHIAAIMSADQLIAAVARISSDDSINTGARAFWAQLLAAHANAKSEAKRK